MSADRRSVNDSAAMTLYVAIMLVLTTGCHWPPALTRAHAHRPPVADTRS